MTTITSPGEKMSLVTNPDMNNSLNSIGKAEFNKSKANSQ
jgi:hypothetical protein